MQIYKYPLEPIELQHITMPSGSEILSVQVQGRVGCLWALVDDKSESVETRTIRTYATGQPCDESNLNFIDTIQFQGGALVFHVFEVK